MAIDEEQRAAIKGPSSALSSSHLLLKCSISAKLQARDEHVRESWVRAMEARLVREELDKCQRTEGVNSFENCKWLSDKLLEKLNDSRVKGYKQVDV
ncbi:hypothetical protein F5880DRAFT_1472978 [Lentinula raphanica]|nr:hypothetical protein F5880DRAFT_1472978 [Lentinula raphanica]